MVHSAQYIYHQSSNIEGSRIDAAHGSTQDTIKAHVAQAVEPWRPKHVFLVYQTKKKKASKQRVRRLFAPGYLTRRYFGATSPAAPANTSCVSLSRKSSFSSSGIATGGCTSSSDLESWLVSGPSSSGSADLQQRQRRRLSDLLAE